MLAVDLKLHHILKMAAFKFIRINIKLIKKKKFDQFCLIVICKIRNQMLKKRSRFFSKGLKNSVLINWTKISIKLY